MFEDTLYPKEVIAVMTEVLNGSYQGSNPESHIDQLLGDFYLKLEDKKGWVFKIGQAVKSLGCLDCVYARLNLECLLEAHEGDKITIRYNRQRLLPGENHGLGCGCRACAMRTPTSSRALTQGSSDKPPDKQLVEPQKKALPPRIHLEELPDPSASYEKRHQGTSALANSEIADKRGLQDALDRNRSRCSGPITPSRAAMVPVDNSETKILTKEEQKEQAERSTVWHLSSIKPRKNRKLSAIIQSRARKARMVKKSSSILQIRRLLMNLKRHSTRMR